MPLGLTVPSNLQDLTLEELHALHAQMWAERADLRQKQQSIMPTLWAKQLQRDMETRAGFDTVIKTGPARFSLAKAQQYISDAREGLVTLTHDMMERLKRIVASGKDEQ